jgi:hypothetical protein
MVLLSISRRAPKIPDAESRKTRRERANVRVPPVPLERRERRRHVTPP